MSQKQQKKTGCTYNQLFPLLQASLQAGVSTLLLGAPGIGKSSIARELAQTLRLPLIDIRLAQKDPAELGGVYFPNKETQTLELYAPDWVKQACAEPCLVFLDEFNAAVTKLHQAAAYQIVLEKRIGNFQFHPGTVVLAAGNREEDNAIVTTLSSALCNRFAHFEMRPDTGCWLEWAAENAVNEHIMAFVKTYGEEVLFAPAEDHAFATPRSWAMASRIMEYMPQANWKKAIAACVGEAMADRFDKYLKIYRKVRAEKIISGKETIDFTKQYDPSFTYAAIFSVAGYISSNDIPDEYLPNVVKFFSSPGVSPEFQMLFLRQLRNRAQEVFDRLKRLEQFRKIASDLVNLRASLYR